MTPSTVRTSKDLAAALNVTWRTVRNWLRYEDFPAQKRGAWIVTEVAAWARRMRSDTKSRSLGGGRRIAGARKVRGGPAPRARAAPAAPPPVDPPPVLDELTESLDLGQGPRRSVDDPRLTKIRLQNVILAHDIKERREAMISRTELAKMFTARMREWRRHLLGFARAVAPKIVGCPDLKFIEVTISSEVLKLLWLAYGRDRDAEFKAADLDDEDTKRNTPGKGEPKPETATQPLADKEPDSGSPVSQ